MGWGFWDVKEGFQNVREENIIKEMEKSEEGRNLISWVTEFFRARRFKLEWDGKTKERGKTNLRAL